jgi:hypothetical protein
VGCKTVVSFIAILKMQDQQSKYPVLQTEMDTDAPLYDVAKCEEQIANCITTKEKSSFNAREA